MSVTLRTAGYWESKNGPYKPWILEHNHEIEPWTHLSDWKTDLSFSDDTKKDLEALEGWCTPNIVPAPQPEDNS